MSRSDPWGREDPLEEDAENHSSLLAWRIRGQRILAACSPWGSQRVRHSWSDLAHPATNMNALRHIQWYEEISLFIIQILSRHIILMKLANLKGYLITIDKVQIHEKANNIFCTLNIQGRIERKSKRTISSKLRATVFSEETEKAGHTEGFTDAGALWNKTEGTTHRAIFFPYSLYTSSEFSYLLTISWLSKSEGLPPRSSHWAGRPSLTWPHPSPLWPGHVAYSLPLSATLASTSLPLHLDLLGSPCQEHSSEIHLAQAFPSFRPPLRRHVPSWASWPRLPTLCSPTHWSPQHQAPPTPDHWPSRL